MTDLTCTGRVHRASLLLCLLLVLGLVACDEEKKDDKKDSTLPPPVVDLPSPPSADAFKIPEKNPDGTLRVEGLIENQEKHLDKEVTVKGVIVQMSEECDPKKAAEEGKKCPRPNLMIKDSADGRKGLVVVGYEHEFVKRATLEVGQPYDFKGNYQKVASGFAATEDGLLQLNYVGEEAVLEDDGKKK